jgi:enamine deaminase RidA (YjgF/YER057c/UK114 family)
VAGRIDQRLERLGIVLPTPPAPVGAYVPALITGPLVFLSGQLPLLDGALAARGVLGREIGLEEGQRLAKLCGLNILAQLKAILDGDLDRVRRCVRLGVFVASSDDFTQQPAVGNGASALMVEVFGEAGRHVRSALGVNVLPLGAPIEIEAVFEIA